MKSRFLTLGFGVVLGAALLLVGWQFILNPYKYQGSLIDPPAEAADFELTDQDGQPFRLSDQRDKVVLMFFGYTNCPDVCPATLAEFIRIKDDLGEQAGEVRFVFITVDPERDTQERIKTHLANFDTGFIGLTGAREQLEPVWKAYGVYQAKQEAGSAAGELIDHTARVYAIDRGGNWRLTYPFEMDWQAIAQDIRHLVREQ